jgi:hypothetical protein
MNPLSIPLIKISSSDSNSDGKIDSFDLQIKFRSDPSKIRQIQVLGTFDYFIQDKIKMQQIGMMNFQVDTPNGASSIIVDGSLQLEQTKPILIDSIPRTLYNQDPITDVNFEQYSIEEIIKNYNKRSGKFV